MIKLILMAALLFVSVASMAQQVVVGKNNEAIIDNRAMPAGTITKAKKPRTTDATNSTMGTNDLKNLASAESNKTVSHYFEVAKTDALQNNWLSAFKSCENYNSGDDKMEWRLPTQRELMLIWTMQVTLINKVSSFTPFGRQTLYWIATESSSDKAWCMFMANEINYGRTYDYGVKTSSYVVRCVRDLDPQ